ncbi:trypsin-like serine protease [Streptomyces bluensis]|uniref:trypsin-like serine protease n=1 Tax=Streptomyces bluensis TaxID=33897 RepID=UPI0016770F1F|nr:trypsin-like serine protease [Streptomyces bluensis]GGZ92323.1 esterase [Streptomyces bluensis]
MYTPRRRGLGRTAVVAVGLLVAPFLVASPAHAVSGTAETNNAHSFTARLDIGDGQRACSAALVDAEWLLTAASCFAEDPNTSLSVAAGAPTLKTTATIGRTDLATTTGQVRKVVELVPREDRDMVLARLAAPVLNVPAVPLATTAPTTGENLTATGYGRTKAEWAPLKLHAGSFTAAAPAGNDLPVTGQNGAAVCAGDTGGPLLRSTPSGAELVGISSRSSQGGCFGSDEAQTSTDAVSVRADDLAAWVTSKTKQTRITDFNGDGVEDIAVADPKASVGGDAGAGLVRVVYGGGKGIAQIDQDLDWVPGGAEANDGFGEALATVDYDQDGYTDLVVATPGEELAGAANAGMVDVLFGGPSGLGSAAVKSTHLEQGTGTGAILASASEAGDRMGQALAAGTTAAGRPWILIGVPGESVGTEAEGGMAFYVYGDTSRTLHQDLPTNVPGVVEAGDRFGASVAGDENFFAIGAPGEAIGTAADSGTVALFSHTLDADGRPTTIGGLDQDNSAVTGAAEEGDEFGAALAMTAYRPSAAAGTDTSMLAIGSPGETTTAGGTDRVEAGRAILVRINADTTWTYLRELRQGEADDTVVGTSEAGDRMGESLTAINTAPRDVATAATLLLAVGTPGEAIGTEAKAGAIHTFSMLGAAGDNDLWIEAGDGDGIPGTPKADQRLGQSIHFTGTRLYAGMPYGPTAYGALHALPLGNVVPGGTNGAVTTYQPGTGGLPAAGTDFGYAAR